MHTLWPADEDLPTSRNFPTQRNMEQSMKTATNVAGLKCYQCARLQKPKPQKIPSRAEALTLETFGDGLMASDFP